MILIEIGSKEQEQKNMTMIVFVSLHLATYAPNQFLAD